MQPSVPGNLESTVDEIVETMRVAGDTSSAPRSAHLTGPETAGKSTTLRSIRQRLTEGDREVPVVVSPPRQSLDAGQVGLVQVAGQLEDAGLLNGGFRTFVESDQITWSDRQQRLSSWLEAHSDRVVLLCDEPYRWATGSEKARHFDDKTESFVRLLLDKTDCRRVVTSKRGSQVDGPRFDVGEQRDYRGWLTGGDATWGVLGDTAHQLWERFDDQLHVLSPLKVRLLVALARLQSADWLEQRFEQFSDGSRKRLTNHLVDAVSRRSSGEAFLSSWERCSLVREPIDSQLVDDFTDGTVGGPAIEQPLRDILTNCILYPIGDQFVLHEILQLNSKPDETRWLSEVQKQKTHELLADYYAEQFGALTDPEEAERALRCELEGFHHAVQTERQEIERDFRLFFVEQLNLFGRRLSHDLDEYAKATSVFERAVDRDEQNDYSHHYLAYNLDIRGIDADRVERHYQRAIELDDEHPWWWSRWICFLITRGRLREARDQWDEALDALGLPTFEATPDAYYKNLHKWVARLLLEAGKLDFAQRVLQGVPRRQKEELRGFRAMEQQLERLRDAQRHQTVFPAFVSYDEQWKGPHLHPENYEGQPLQRWLPARVEGVSDDVVLVVAEQQESDNDIAYGQMEIPVDTFDTWSEAIEASELQEGRFLELAIYGSPDSSPRIRAHHKTFYDPDDLPPLLLDPNRYLQSDAP